MASLKTETVDGWTNMLGQFLSAAMIVFPECNQLKEYKLGYDLVLTMGESAKLKLLTEYHNSLSPYYKRCAEKDPTVFTEENIEILNSLSLREKWLDPSVSDETRDTIWAYVQHLNHLAQLHFGFLENMPTDTMSKIHEKVVAMADRPKKVIALAEIF